MNTEELSVGFRKQIIEDIRDYQKKYFAMRNIKKDEWAFNFWILDNLFNIDEELIESNICDYNDKGIDCFYFNEDTNDLYLIQNKFYEETPLSLNYIKDDFLLRPINWLKTDNYKRSQELQNIWNKYSKMSNFTVHLELYISNNNISEKIYEEIHNFMSENNNIIVDIFTLDKIKEKYYGEITIDEKLMTFEIETINNGTILNVNPKDYKLNNPLDAKYVFAPVITLYKMRKQSYDLGYPLFNENIREYLGNTGINKKIFNTLMDEKERKNFFYYNNGITIICDKLSSVTTRPSFNNRNAQITICNPQVVNGCQTVSSIYEALSICPPSDLEEKFKDCFVMLKILQIDKNDNESNQLKENIVRYNNSQNSIDEKTFIANNDEFKRLQKVFESKGFLLLIKQSDENKFLSEYKTPTRLIERSKELLDKYGLEYTKTKDFTIKLEKFLQVIISFKKGGYFAYVKKPNLLKINSDEYNLLIDFIKSDSVTTQTLIDLYLLFNKSEIVKKESLDKRTPISYYLIDAFAQIECEGRNPDKILKILNSKNNINEIICKYSQMTKLYSTLYESEYNVDYNKMIKQNIDEKLFSTAIKTAESSYKIGV